MTVHTIRDETGIDYKRVKRYLDNKQGLVKQHRVKTFKQFANGKTNLLYYIDDKEVDDLGHMLMVMQNMRDCKDYHIKTLYKKFKKLRPENIQKLWDMYMDKN